MNIEIKNVFTVLSDEQNVTVEKTDVYIKNSEIVGVNEKPKEFLAEKTIDGKGKKLLIPGLINTHTHSYMSLFRNIADDLPFHDWLFKRIEPLENQLSSKDAYWGALLSCVEMIKSGTTCFADMHMFKNKIVNAVNESRIRAVLGRGLVGSYENGIVNDGDRVKEFIDDIEYYSDNFNDDLISFFLAPHAIYTCTPDYLRYISDIAEERKLGIQIHVSESKAEVDNCCEQFKMTPVELLDEIGLLQNHVLAAHCVHVNENDISILSKNNTNVATNPISNMKLGNGFAPISSMLEAGVNISLGTDSAASNNSLNLFRELNILTLIHKGINRDSTSISSTEGFCFATKNGAKSLKLENKIGCIKTGMKADLALLNLDTPSFSPHNNLLAALAYSVNGSEVETVIINGEIIMDNYDIKTIDVERVYFEVNRICEKFH